MAAGYKIVLSPEAVDQLSKFSRRQRRIILDAIEAHLTVEPTIITRRRKPLRPNPLASWELRIDQFRVYYQVEPGEERKVYVIAVGKKIHNRVIIGGTEVKL